MHYLIYKQRLQSDRATELQSYRAKNEGGDYGSGNPVIPFRKICLRSDQITLTCTQTQSKTSNLILQTRIISAKGDREKRDMNKNLRSKGRRGGRGGRGGRYQPPPPFHPSHVAIPRLGDEAETRLEVQTPETSGVQHYCAGQHPQHVTHLQMF